MKGCGTVRSAGGEAETLERLDRSLKRLYAAGMRIMRTMAGLMGLNEFASQVVVTIALTVAAIALQGGEISAEEVLVYPFFINVFLSNVRDLAAAAFDWNRFFVEGGRLAAVLYAEEEEESSPESGAEWFREDAPVEISGLAIGFGGRTPSC